MVNVHVPSVCAHYLLPIWLCFLPMYIHFLHTYDEITITSTWNLFYCGDQILINIFLLDIASIFCSFNFMLLWYSFRLHVIDLDPSSVTSGGWLEDTSLVEKYTIPDDAYAKRNGKVINFIRYARFVQLFFVFKSYQECKFWLLS